jgi:hypothetical protein
VQDYNSGAEWPVLQYTPGHFFIEAMAPEYSSPTLGSSRIFALYVKFRIERQLRDGCGKQASAGPYIPSNNA